MQRFNDMVQIEPDDDLIDVETCSLNYIIKFDVFDVHCYIILKKRFIFPPLEFSNIFVIRNEM